MQHHDGRSIRRTFVDVMHAQGRAPLVGDVDVAGLEPIVGKSFEPLVRCAENLHFTLLLSPRGCSGLSARESNLPKGQYRNPGPNDPFGPEFRVWIRVTQEAERSWRVRRRLGPGVALGPGLFPLFGQIDRLIGEVDDRIR